MNSYHYLCQVRIISGLYKGKNVQAPGHLPVRPTTDFARTGLFNLLNSRLDIEEISFIDLFSGTGIISFEMASRGCKDITAVDKDRNCVQFIKQTVNSWKIPGLRTVKQDVFDFIEKSGLHADLVFADPPYAHARLREIPGLILKASMVKENGYFILEHGDEDTFDNYPHFVEQRNYSNVNFSIFQF